MLFDGVCNLCNGAVNFLIDNDRKGKLHFASLQSEYGQRVLKYFDLPTEEFGSFIFLTREGRLYQKSTAALEVAKKMGGGWSLFYAFIVIPKFIRDGIYSLIARNRYDWFGKRETCRMPTPELKSRFLENA